MTEKVRLSILYVQEAMADYDSDKNWNSYSNIDLLLPSLELALHWYQMLT